jgi:hypothetical protein
MELFLNILWVLIALAALAVWRCGWTREEHAVDTKPWRQWTAFSCALVFVFFAVSLSDDLRAATILADDCTLGRHQSLTWNCGCSAHAAGSADAFLPVLPAAPFARPVEIGMQIRVSPCLCDGTNNRAHIALRGPPNNSR